MTKLSEVEVVSVPRACAEHIHTHLRRVGRDGYEGLGLWVGQQHGRMFQVTQAVVPAQRHIRTDDGVCVVTEAAELHRLNVWLYKEKLRLIAQLHSHPGRAYHSDTDDAYAVATTVGCFSLVVPDFASAPFAIARTACYRLAASGRWTPVSAAAAHRCIVIEA